jgi:hypothetical protein
MNERPIWDVEAPGYGYSRPCSVAVPIALANIALTETYIENYVGDESCGLHQAYLLGLPNIPAILVWDPSGAPLPYGPDQTYEMVDGHHRHEACRRAGFTHIMAKVIMPSGVENPRSRKHFTYETRWAHLLP